MNLMRLSLEKAAYVAVFESSVVGKPKFARDDKVLVSVYLNSRCEGWTGRPQLIRDLRLLV